MDYLLVKGNIIRVTRNNNKRTSLTLTTVDMLKDSHPLPNATHITVKNSTIGKKRNKHKGVNFENIRT